MFIKPAPTLTFNQTNRWTEQAANRYACREEHTKRAKRIPPPLL